MITTVTNVVNQKRLIVDFEVSFRLEKFLNLKISQDSLVPIVRTPLVIFWNIESPILRYKIQRFNAQCKLLIMFSDTLTKPYCENVVK